MFDGESDSGSVHVIEHIITTFLHSHRLQAAEGEFAFVIAVFSVDNGLISPDLYASIVLAVLISTIIPPFALRFTISYYNKIAERMVRNAEDIERQRAGTIDETLSPVEQEKRFRERIEANKVIFLCIQIQCASTWGLIPRIISKLGSLGLEVIDNRSWHPRGVDSTLMTEIFVEDDFFLRASDEETNKTIEERIAEVNESMMVAIKQPSAKVKVTRWYPGVLQAIVEEVKSKSSISKSTVSGTVKDALAREATQTLETKRNKAISATQEKSLDQIKREMGIPVESAPEEVPIPTEQLGTQAPKPSTTRRRVRQKMRSTPVTGGSLFDTPEPSTTQSDAVADADSKQAISNDLAGQAAELVVNGEVFKIRVLPQTVQRIRSGYSGELLDDSSVKFSAKDVPLEHRLQGFVRTSQMQTITEEDNTDAVSNHQSEVDSEQGGGW